MYKRIIEKYKKREFFKNVGTILSGSTVAQIVPILVAPILSRIFTPTEFGIFAVYLSVVHIIGFISTGRYEYALVIPKSDKEAFHLFILSFIIIAGVSLGSLLILLIFKQLIIDLFNIQRIERWLYLIPISSFLLGLNNLLNYYNTRLKKYKAIATTSVVRSIGRSVFQLASGILKYGVSGLVFGEISAMAAGNITQSLPVRKEIKRHTFDFNLMKKSAVRYKRFPLISMWAALFNTAAQNMGNFFITSLFNIEKTGFYSYSVKYISIPINMIGSAIGQVLMQQASDSRKEKGNAVKEYWAVLSKLLMVAIPSFFILYLFVEDIFTWYFGEDWRTAGYYAKILIPFLYARFITMPLSVLNSVFEKQFLSLYWQLGLFLITIVVYFITKTNDLSIESYLRITSWTFFFYYHLLVILLYFVVKGSFDKYKWL